MLSKDRILTLDIGVRKVVLGEFSVRDPGAPVLTRYAVRELDISAADAVTRSMASFSDVVRELMVEAGIRPAPLNVMLSGQAVFPRFVKLPPVSADKVEDMVRYEAAENLPFPVEEVVWDYQVIDDASAAELDVLIVATKREAADDMAACAEAVGLDLNVVDVMPFALYNCVRFNCPDDTGCTLLLDIGARSTNLVFVEGSRVFTRSISVAGNTITNEIARSLGVSTAEAEQIKRETGFVALGGTYAVVDDETADKVSKVIRNVVTRLHSEVNRSINFYRSQQGGSPPDKLLLTGGTSLTRHMDTFFREKLGIETDYLNPFQNVAVAPGIQEDMEALFLMAPSVGLALRGCMKCPIEINLMPPAVVSAQRFAKRIPFFGVAVAGLVLTLLCWFSYAKNLQAVYSEQNEQVRTRLAERTGYQRQIDAVRQDVADLEAQNHYLAAMVASRPAYARVLGAVRAAMIEDTWVRSLTFDSEPEGDVMRIVVGGFKRELDANVTNKSAGELLLANLLETGDLFVREGSRVERERSTENERLSEMHLRLRLSRRLGHVDENWLKEWASQ